MWWLHTLARSQRKISRITLFSFMNFLMVSWIFLVMKSLIFWCMVGRRDFDSCVSWKPQITLTLLDLMSSSLLLWSIEGYKIVLLSCVCFTCNNNDYFASAEILDFGYPQNTDTGILKTFITQQGVKSQVTIIQSITCFLIPFAMMYYNH